MFALKYSFIQKINSYLYDFLIPIAIMSHLNILKSFAFAIGTLIQFDNFITGHKIIEQWSDEQDRQIDPVDKSNGFKTLDIEKMLFIDFIP